MLYLWFWLMALVAVVAFVASVFAFLGAKLLLGFGLFILAAIAAVISATAYYARERVNSVREFFGWPA